ncbi:MAG: D-alanine--D-alanine ligase [Bdellovibrionales bacterium]
MEKTTMAQALPDKNPANIEDQQNAIMMDKGYAHASDIAEGDNKGPAISYYEFWPTWLFYFPMKLYGLYLAIKHRGLTLPTITDPLFDVGGFHGESKAQIFTQIPESLYSQFAYTLSVDVKNGEPNNHILETALKGIEEQNWQLPIIAKPDIGLRGMGVQRIFTKEDLLSYIQAFPKNERFVLQDMYDFPLEVGLFYYRRPDEDKGHIFSITTKDFSYVVGDGQSTLKSLIENHRRYGRIKHVFFPRHADKLDMVLNEGERYRIAFAGSHSRGTIFRDGNHLITPKMEAAWDNVAKQIPEFYFGRFDIRLNDYKDLETLENIKIVEVNGAGAEATHIWDPKTSIWTAYKVLMKQYRIMFEIGAANKKRGFKPMPLKMLLARMDRAEALSNQYPQTH